MGEVCLSILGRGGGVIVKMNYIGICCCDGYGFLVVWFKIGYRYYIVLI